MSDPKVRYEIVDKARCSFCEGIGPSVMIRLDHTFRGIGTEDILSVDIPLCDKCLNDLNEKLADRFDELGL